MRDHHRPQAAAVTIGPPLMPLAAAGEPVRYVLIDDEPRYRQAIDVSVGLAMELVGGYHSVEAFLAVQRQPCHVVVLDLCLNRQTGDKAVLQGVRAIRNLAGQLGHRVVIYTADERPEPVARCVAAGAAGYVSKYQDPSALAAAIDEVGRLGSIVNGSLHQALRDLAARCGDIRLSGTLEQTLVLLQTGISDAEIARRRQLSARTIEDHKRKILEIFGATMEARNQGFAQLTRDLGIGPGDLVNDQAGHRPARGLLARAMPWTRNHRQKPGPDVGARS
jgi:DNA-binding NarL/FixJ family response regulator